MVVWKYPLALTQVQYLNLPEDFKILDIQMQREEIVLWALVNPHKNKTQVTISMFGTGHEEIPVSLRDSYIATVQDGSLVWNFFLGR